MTAAEVNELARDALDAAIAIIRERIPNQYTGDMGGHLFKLHDELRAFIRDELPTAERPR